MESGFLIMKTGVLLGTSKSMLFELPVIYDSCGCFTTIGMALKCHHYIMQRLLTNYNREYNIYRFKKGDSLCL